MSFLAFYNDYECTKYLDLCMRKFVWFVSKTMVQYFGYMKYMFLYSGNTLFMALLTAVKQSVPPTLIVSHIIGKGHTTSL